VNDKDIRKILIAYLKASGRKMRIYQEKSIGTSVCDVMVVTDRLTGYEIKSDLDNYQRLSAQVSAYSRFFDENYLVVSRRHLKSASDKIPADWGIICICDSSVTIERKASYNPKVSRRRQLSILWKLELKNLLAQNNMPLYAQKEKGYIADRIAEYVPPIKLGSQIAQELMNRDYSVYNAEDYTMRFDGDDPEASPRIELIDTLSEENLSEFTLDKWISLYQQAKNIQEQKQEKEKTHRIDRTPHNIPYTDIEVSMGAPWISPEIINQFANYIAFGDTEYAQSKYLVKYERITGSWFIVDKKYHSNVATTATYGIPRYNALFIIEATLNLREIKLFDNGNRYNQEDTIAALEKQKLLISTFKEWIWQDEDRIWQVEEAYNKMFADLSRKSFDGSRLDFPEMSEEFSLYPYQKDAVQRIVNEKNTLLAFDVGAGKTYIMIAAAMKMRQEGISRKNMFVVPNNIVGQWEQIFTSLYPKAKVLTVEPKAFKPEMRTKVKTQMRDGDYDGIIIAYSCFEMIPLSEQYVTNAMGRQIKLLDEAARRISQYGWDRAAINREKEVIRKQAQELIALLDSVNRFAPEITFEQLEINSLFLDEAHNYKNIPIRTKLRDLRGINTNGSTKCLDMLQKVRCVQEQNGGRGVVFATGTPLCNSISDVYTMQMYLQSKALEERKLHQFDNWVRTFALPEQICEIDVDASKFRFVRRFSKFFNLPELSLMFSQIAVFHSMSNKDGLPAFGGYDDVVIKKHQALSDYMQTLCVRTEKIRSKEVKRNEDNMLKVSIDGRKAALDLTLVRKQQAYDCTSKVWQCVQQTLEVYRDNPNCSQLIFCDYSTPKGENFSVYAKIKEQLVEQGVPEKEIAFIHNYQSEQRKLSLYEKVNSGKVRVLIGSTFKLGIGANVQTKLKAIHHLDVPWRPADMVQREGRILRRGNTNESVMIFRYIAEGSFDAYSWQILENKQKFISQFLSGSTSQRSASDLEENILSYAEVKALALSMPLMKQYAEKENELRNLRILRLQFDSTRRHLEEEANQIRSHRPNLWAAALNQDFLSELSEKDYTQAVQLHANVLTEQLIMRGGHVNSILGFAVTIPEKQNEKEPYIILERSGGEYIVRMGSSPRGNITRVINFLKKFDGTVEKLHRLHDDQNDRLHEIETKLKESNPYIDQVDLCSQELDKLREMLKVMEEDKDCS